MSRVWLAVLPAIFLAISSAAPASAGWLHRGYEPWEEVEATDRVDWIDAAPQIAGPKTRSYLNDDSVIAILAERGFWAISPGRRHRDVFLASATDARGNRLRVAVSRRTGEIRRIAELGRREIWQPVRHHQD